MSSGAGGAGAAGAAAGGIGGDAGGQQGEATNGNGQGLDLAALAEQLGGTNESLEQMREFLLSQPWAQAQAGEYGADAEGEQSVDLSFFDHDDEGELDGYADDELGDDDATEQTIEALANATEGFVESATAPLAERVDQMQRAAEWQQIAEEFPDLSDVDTARETFQIAGAYAEAKGWPAEVAASPGLVRLIYMAGMAVRAAQEEGGEGDDVAHLEGGAGAAGAGAPEGNHIVQALSQQSGLPDWLR